jgi:murein DD-endopeptidase MepM/ murein hydrolase activator NlpD
VTLRGLLRTVADYRKRAFVPREVFFRSGDRFHHMTISAGTLKLGALASLVLATWILYATGAYVVDSFLLSSKDREIERHQLAYFDLLSEVSEYHNQFARITTDLQGNQDYLLSLLEQNPGDPEKRAEIESHLKGSETERARVVIARGGLHGKMQQFESDLLQIANRNKSLQSQAKQMSAMLQSSEAERDQVEAAREQLVVRLAEVEGDLERMRESNGALQSEATDLSETLATTQAERGELAERKATLEDRAADLGRQLAESRASQGRLEDDIAGLNAQLAQTIDTNRQIEDQRDFLARRVGGLEQRLVDLRDAEQVVIDRLSERTRLSIDVIEKTIEMTGLEVGSLVASVQNQELGQGGPFIPAADEASNFEPSVQLEASVSLLDQQLDRWTALQEVLRSVPLSAPLNQYRISSGYGARKDPVNGRKARHQGVDFAAHVRAPVYVTAPGKVVFAGWRGRYGRTIEIDHGHGIRTRYSHLRKILVKAGEEVGNRHKIGLLGSSGRSTGPHVHYEIRYKGRAQDPMKFLKAGDHVFKG